MRRSCIIVLLLSLCLFANAQSRRELRDSLEIVAKELAFRPDSIDLRLKKAGLNLQLEQWDYARSEYDYVLKMEPQNVAALYYRAYVHEQLRKYKFARNDYEKLLSIVPGNFEASLGLALLNQKDKHFTEALDMLNVLCDRYPNRSEAFAARAGVEEERGMLDVADYDYQQAIALEPSNTDYRLSRVDVLIRLHQYTDAREALDELVALGIPRPSLGKLYKQLK